MCLLGGPCLTPVYTVREKINPCIHCNNSGKEYQILTEFWTNNAMSNCNQITKFK